MTNKERRKIYNRQYYIKRQEYHLARSKKYREENPDKVRETYRKWCQKKRKEYNKMRLDYYHKNRDRLMEIRRLTLDPEKVRMYRKNYSIKRAKQKEQATPSWIDVFELQSIYDNCPRDKEVDHIVPLLSKHVCGLHVPWNLQYLTPEENSKKGNRFEGMP